MVSEDQPTARIDRMEANGVLTPAQAATLRASVGRATPDDHASADVRSPRRRGFGWWVAIAVCIVLAAAVFVSGGGEPGAVQDVAETLNQQGAQGTMNRSVSTVLAVALLLIVPLVAWVLLHNSLVAKEEKVFEAWAQTESNFQRRADLIPALVETVSRYLRHESDTQTEIARERAQASERLAGAIDALVEAEKASNDILGGNGHQLLERDADLARLFQAQARIGRSTGALLAVVEDYPELRSSDQFLELQAQIEGTENRINVARMRFNDAVRLYNKTIRQLPWTLVAGAGGFQRKAYFQSDEGTRDAPELPFEQAD